jgi:hypothetical protein
VIKAVISSLITAMLAVTLLTVAAMPAVAGRSFSQILERDSMVVEPSSLEGPSQKWLPAGWWCDGHIPELPVKVLP